MKSIIAAVLVSFVLADDPAPTPADKAAGTPCTTNPSCGGGDDTKMCCGIATGGMVCGDATCTADKMTKTAGPNVLVCQAIAEADQKAVIVDQVGADGTTHTYIQYPAKMTCVSGAKALAAGAIAMIATASMM